MHRFFIDPTLLSSITSTTEATITLPEKLAHQVRDVLHLNIGEQLILLDNSGDEILASVIKSGRAGVEVRIIERRKGQSESPVRIVLCQGLLKSARFEWILEKGTELGVSTFAPILCRRSMAGLEEVGPAKIQRWQRIIQEATEQCGRSRRPELLSIRPLIHALNDIPEGALALMPWEEEREKTLRSVLDQYSADVNAQGFGRATAKVAPTGDAASPPTVVLFIGPEGGLMAEEVALAKRHGVQAVSLGTRILRAETAALVAVANVMFALEE
jgi:16S rRNA (uracil1498-N3)-methyltransferase